MGSVQNRWNGLIVDVLIDHAWKCRAMQEKSSYLGWGLIILYISLFRNCCNCFAFFKTGFEFSLVFMIIFSSKYEFDFCVRALILYLVNKICIDVCMQCFDNNLQFMGIFFSLQYMSHKGFSLGRNKFVFVSFGTSQVTHSNHSPDWSRIVSAVT